MHRTYRQIRPRVKARCGRFSPVAAVRRRVRHWSVAFVGVIGAVALLSPATLRSEPPRPVPSVRPAVDDSGDWRDTTVDDPLVRRRTAIALDPVRWADREQLRRRLAAAATAERLGPLTEATFAVFSPELLTYLVPEMVVVLPHGASPRDADLLMTKHRHPSVAFHLVASVLVHHLTFAVTPVAVSAAQVEDRIDREGVLSASLGRYDLATRGARLTVRYLGAVLSTGQLLAVRASMARAANVAVDQVRVEPLP